MFHDHTLVLTECIRYTAAHGKTSLTRHVFKPPLTARLQGVALYTLMVRLTVKQHRIEDLTFGSGLHFIHAPLPIQPDKVDSFIGAAQARWAGLDP